MHANLYSLNLELPNNLKLLLGRAGGRIFPKTQREIGWVAGNNGKKKKKKKSFVVLKTSTQNLQRGQYALFLDLRGDNFSDPGREGGGNCPP